MTGSQRTDHRAGIGTNVTFGFPLTLQFRGRQYHGLRIIALLKWERPPGLKRKGIQMQVGLPALGTIGATQISIQPWLPK